MTPRALFRFEADAATGGGHAARCLSFAEALRWAGWRIAFSTSAASVATIPALATCGAVIVPPAANDDDPSTRLVVFDHYGIDARTERGFAGEGRLIVAFDDLADRPHACGVLVDPAPGRRAADYAPRVPADCQLLLGPSHAILGARWRAAAGASRARIAAGGAVRRLLVSMGATDPEDATGRVLDAIDAAGLDVDVDVILGAAAPHRRRIEARLGGRQTLHVQPSDIVSIVAAADLAIGAAGSSSYERAALGVPSILVPTAANQSDTAHGFTAAGAAHVVARALLDAPRDLAAEITALARDARRRIALAQAGTELSDGRGALRLLAAIAGTQAGRNGEALQLRLAEARDADWLLELQSAPGTRRYTRHPTVPGAAEHAAWMTRTLADPERLLCIVEHAGTPVAMVRLDRLDAGAPRFEVSIAVHPTAQRRGIGKAALTLLRRLAAGAILDAHVHTENAASRALFATAGYRQIVGSEWRSSP